MKKFLVVLMAVAMVVVMAVSTSAADTGTGLVAFYKFEGNFNNEVEGGAAGAAIGKQFAAATGDAVFADGKFTIATAVADGAKIDADITDSYSVSFYFSADTYQFASPIVWIGSQTQSPENWNGVWMDFDVAYGPAFGSNTSNGDRLGIKGGADYPIDNLYITFVVDGGEAYLYYNGVLMGNTNDNGFQTTWATVTEDIAALTVPNPWTAEDCAIYLGVNAWGDPVANATYDNLAIYGRALSADDVAALYAAGGVPAVGEAPVDPADPGEDDAPQTGFATIAIAVAAIGSGAFIVSKKRK